MVTGMRKQAVMLNMAACSNLRNLTDFSSRVNSGTYCLEGFISRLTTRKNYTIDISFRFRRVLRDLHICFTQ